MDFKDNTGIRNFLLKETFSFLTGEIGKTGEGEEKLREIGNKEEKNTTIGRTSDFGSIGKNKYYKKTKNKYYNYYNGYKYYININIVLYKDSLKV